MRQIIAIAAVAVAVAVLGLAGPAGARTIENWDVKVAPDAHSCTMVSTFADDVSIGLVWAPDRGELGFLATVPHPNGLAGKAAVPIAISFDGGGRYTQWEDDGAHVVAGLDADAVLANWGPSHAEDLAGALQAAGHVTLTVGGKEIGTYDLSGGPAAYRALTRCGSQLASR